MYWTLLPYLYKVVDGERLSFLYMQQHLSWKKQLAIFAFIRNLFFILFVLKNDNKKGVEKWWNRKKR